MLKYKYATQEEIPAEFRNLYSEVGGEWVLTGVSGIKTQEDVDRVQEALRKEREDHKSTKDKFRALGDRNVDDILADLDKIDEYKMAAEGKMDDEKVNQIVETRIKSRTAPLERQINQLQGQLSERDGEIEQYKTKETRRTIHDHVRKAAQGAKLRDTAIDDALMMGENVFTVDESGNVVTKDNVGVTPGVQPDVWLTDMKQKRPHWWPESRGAGANGGEGGSGGTNPWNKDDWNITEQGKIYKENPERAAQLAKSAGTSIGGPRPK